MLGTPITLKGPHELESPWRTLWKPFLIERADDGLIVRVTAHEWGVYSIDAPGRQVNVTDVWRALVESRNDVIRLGASPLPNQVHLHAASLVRDEKALLLIGDAWSGKTTLALALVHRGWTYFSDDLALLDIDSGQIRPVPKPPGVKAHAWDEMKQYWQVEPTHLGGPPGPFLIPPPFNGSLEDRARPAWFIFPSFEEGRGTELKQISVAESVAQAAQNSGRLDGNALRALAKTGMACEHFELKYSNSENAADKLGHSCLCRITKAPYTG